MKNYQTVFSNKSLNHKLRIFNSLYLKALFSVSFPPPYAMLLINLNAMHVAFSARIFFYVSPLAGFFLDKFPLQEFFWGIVTSPPDVSNGPSPFFGACNCSPC